MFKKFFSEKEVVYIELIEELSSGSTINIKEFCQKLGISQYMCDQEIKKINTIVSPSFFFINNTKIHFTLSEGWNIIKLYSIFLRSNVYFNILESIFFEPKHTLLSLSENQFISISTLRRRLNKLKYLLSPLNIEIVSNPLRIVGNEKNIVDFFTLYFVEAYPTHPYPFPDKQVEFFLDFYKDLKKNWNEKTNLAEMSYDTTKVLVNFYRHQTGNYYQELPNPSSIDTGYNLQVFTSEEFIHGFKTIFKTEITPELLVRLFSNYLSFPFQFNFEYLTKSREDPVINHLVIESENFLNSLSQIYAVPLFNFKELLLDLVNFILEQNSREVPFYLLNNFPKRFFLENKEISSIFYSQFEKQFKVYSSNISKRAIDPKSVFFRLIIKWDRLFYSLILKQPKVKIGVVLNSYISHAVLLTEQLRLHYSLYADFQIIYFEDDAKTLNSYQVVITNIPDLNFEGDKIIIDMSLADKDWLMISNTIRKHQSNNNF